MLVLALLPVVCRVPVRAATTSNAGRITVVFRFDDYKWSCSEVGTEVLVLFQKYHIPFTCGVIPYSSGAYSATPENWVPLDQETAAILDDAVRSGLVEVALHGFTHSDNAAVPTSGAESEYRGLDYSSQLRMLSAGRRTLESLYHVSVTTFIPPWNTYDENTLRALESLGFEVISDGGSMQVGGRFQKLRFLPQTCGPDGLRDAVGSARESSDSDPTIVVLFHPLDFVEYRTHRGKLTYEFLDDVLSWIAAQPDVATRTLGEAAKLDQDMGQRRHDAFTAMIASEDMIPSFLLAKGYASFYPSIRCALSARNASRLHFILFGLSLCLLLFTFTVVTVRLAAGPALLRVKPGSSLRIVDYATVSAAGLCIICIGAILASVLWPHHFVRYRYIAVLVGLLVACLGVCVAAGVHQKPSPGE